MTPELEEALRRLAKAAYDTSTWATWLRGEIRRMYTPEEMRERWGTREPLTVMLDDVFEDLVAGRITLRDNASLMCTKQGCARTGIFIKALDAYYRSGGQRARWEYRVRRYLLP
jgi:hypothetical protein